MCSVASAFARGDGVVLNGTTSANLHKNHAPQRRPQAPIHHCKPHRQIIPNLNNHLQIPRPGTLFRNPCCKPHGITTDDEVLSPAPKCGVHKIISLVIQMFSKLESMKHVSLCLDFCIISPPFYDWLCLLWLCAKDNPVQS